MKLLNSFLSIMIVFSASLHAKNIIVLHNHTDLNLKIALALGDEEVICYLLKHEKRHVSVASHACLHNIRAEAVWDKNMYIENNNPNGAIPCVGKRISIYLKDDSKLVMKLDDYVDFEESNLTNSDLSGSSDEDEIGKIIIR